MEQKENVPGHVAIIPDGNRRWAKAKGMDPWKGHEEGAKRIEDIVNKGFEIGIKNMSFWGSSLENFKKRPLQEKQELLNVYEKYFERLIENEEIHKNKARINILGKWREQFPTKLKQLLEDGIRRTENHDKYSLNFLLAYSGDDEIVEAVKSIIDAGYEKEEVTKEVIKENLMTKDLPIVDFLIRTGGEPHNSAGFMMWDIANAQLYYSDKLFPDFGGKDFEEAIREYQRRERRLGK